MKKAIQLLALSFATLVSSSALARTFVETKLTMNFSYANMETNVISKDSLIGKIRIVTSDDQEFCKLSVEGVSIPCKTIDGAVAIHLDYFGAFLNGFQRGAGASRTKKIVLAKFRSEMEKWTLAEMFRNSLIIYVPLKYPSHYRAAEEIRKIQFHSDLSYESVHRTYQIEHINVLN